jgi:MoxR-like ATPase
VNEQRARNVLTPERLKEIQQLIRRMPVPESVVEAILSLVRSARPGKAMRRRTSTSPGVRGRAPARR